MYFHVCIIALFSFICFHNDVEANISQSVKETILNAEAVPGLKSEQFSALREGIAERWDKLEKEGVLLVKGTDSEVRPYFVALQGIVEHVLAIELNKSITNPLGIILTPMPATPLCMNGEVSSKLVDPSIANDPMRLFTVKARATIVRDYLAQGGILYVAYPKDGFIKRTLQQQEIYLQELKNYPENLIDIKLDCAELDPEVIGATYFFTTTEGEEYVFAIKMTQANNPQDSGTFGLWYGPAEHPAIKARVAQVKAAL